MVWGLYSPISPCFRSTMHHLVQVPCLHRGRRSGLPPFLLPSPPMCFPFPAVISSACCHLLAFHAPSHRLSLPSPPPTMPVPVLCCLPPSLFMYFFFFFFLSPWSLDRHSIQVARLPLCRASSPHFPLSRFTLSIVKHQILLTHFS
jgi:hypothetical protein